MENVYAKVYPKRALNNDNGWAGKKIIVNTARLTCTTGSMPYCRLNEYW